MTRLAFSRVRLVVLIPLTLLLLGSRSLFDAERAHLTTPALVVAYGVPIAASAVLVCALTRRPGSRRWDAAALWGALSEVPTSVSARGSSGAASFPVASAGR